MISLSLRQKLLVLTLLPSALLTILLVSYFSLTGLDVLEEQIQSKGVSIVRYLAPISEYAIITGQRDSMQGLARAAGAEPGVKGVLIVDARGRTLAASGRISLTADLLQQPIAGPVLVADHPQWLAFAAPVVRSTDDSMPPLDLPGFVAADAREVIGKVFIELDKKPISERRQILLVHGLLALLLVLFVMSLLSTLLARQIVHPLQRLVRAVRAISSGQWTTRVQADSGGELGVLEAGFNEMAEHAAEARRALQTRIEEATAQLVFQARHDPLTGLVNRREFEECLQRALTALLAGGDQFCLLQINIGRLKSVNESCGYRAGDELLRQIAQLLARQLRPQDCLGRLGGDEFGIILAAATAPRARQVAHELCKLVAAYRFIWQDKIFAVSIRVGLTPAVASVRNAQDMLIRSDAACLEARQLGDGGVRESPSETQEEENRRPPLLWSEHLGQALAAGQLRIEAAPIHDLRRNAPAVKLCLLSLRLQSMQESLPYQMLIDAAERQGVAQAYDHHLLAAAIDLLARSQNSPARLCCLVPVSAKVLETADTLEFVRSRLVAQGVRGQGLCFLFDEALASAHTSRLMAFAQQVRALGCQIALGRFGAGSTSFALLHTLVPSYIQISPSLTRSLPGTNSLTALLRAILDITAEHGVPAIAGDVADVPTLETLAEQGIAYAYGPAIAPREPHLAWFEGVVMRGQVVPD